ncbi:MAG: hypothetical protein JWM36_1480 [Hyphomicrobiales bacterium]|nr:hypothetical protein [Hyphomicrobiales bacterium]
MNARATPSSPKVTRLRPRATEAAGNIVYTQLPTETVQKATAKKLEVARYIGQMTLELERLAGTADLELLAYFLAMARSEAEAATGQSFSGTE